MLYWRSFTDDSTPELEVFIVYVHGRVLDIGELARVSIFFSLFYFTVAMLPIM